MVMRREIGWLVAQAWRLAGTRNRALVRARRQGTILPIVCHALPPGELDALLGWLKAHGVNIWLTLDDGWREARDCLPVLEKHGQKAVLFLSPGATQRGNVWTEEARQLGISPDIWRGWYGLGEAERLARLDTAASVDRPVTRRLLDVEDVRALARHPLIEIGNHTWSHLSAPHRPVAEFVDEVERAQKTLEEWAGRRPRFCAYPFGRGTAELDAALGKRGLRPVYTRQGWATAQTLGAARNMAIENVTFAENLGRLLMAWPKVGETV